MSEFAYRRPLHRAIHGVLMRLDSAFLASAECYFGGGTMTVMELDEYRESRDIDFLCANQKGYRALRERVAAVGIQSLFANPVLVVRDPIMDQYGIRTVLALGEERLKFEILREARIPLTGGGPRPDNVVALSNESAFAEKLLANADRGLDRATLCRDAVDLAHMTLGWGTAGAAAGLRIAEAAYGKEIQARLDAVIAWLLGDSAWRARCEQGLSLDNPKLLRRGLEALRAKRWRKAPPV